MFPRYLTKSKYVLGLECPTKLYYSGKRDEYADRSFDDPFLLQLAKGGFQVGELAKCYYPEGIAVTEQDVEGAVAQTEELLAREVVTIFEAAFRFEKLLVRTDILIKNGNQVDLIEVKAKSWPPKEEGVGLLGKKGGINKDFKSKIQDVAFQRFVLSKAHPEWQISSYFLFADKTTKCPTDGFHQKFRIRKEGGRRRCVVEGDVEPQDLDPRILSLVPADEACDLFISELDSFEGIRSFEDHVKFLADHYVNDSKVKPKITSTCGKCQFRAKPEDRQAGMKSGYHECWHEALGWTNEDIDEENILDIWDYRTKDKLIMNGKIRMHDIGEEDIGIKDPTKPGISRTQRQWLQVTKARDYEKDHWIDIAGLDKEIKSWHFPYHFIDFETSMPAIPFKRGRRPYEAIAFQFSHHVVEEDGTVHHRGEFLDTTPGSFPNYDFIRALRDQLQEDKGTIFRYATHENSYLNFIWEQLRADATVADYDELCAFIQLISKSKDKQIEEWHGERNMVDMLDLVKRYYYHPATKGSNSIKHVLPAILNASDHLKEKYSKSLKSTNFPEGKIWVQFNDDGTVKDPYKLLEQLFSDISSKDLDLLSLEDEGLEGIQEGGAAMAAYSLLQFEDMSGEERAAIESGLKRYCELDTLAMVMIYEAWREWLK